MPKPAAVLPVQPCSAVYFESRIEVDQGLGPDLFESRGRDGRGRFSKGCSGNPRGRPRGIPNPVRRVPDLRARPLSPAVLSALVERKPWLLRPLAAQMLPPLRAASDAAVHLGIDVASLASAGEMLDALRAIMSAVTTGEISPAAAGRFARRVRGRMRVLRLAR